MSFQDDYGQKRLSRNTRPIQWDGRFNKSRHVAVSEPQFHEEQCFWFVDAVHRDTPEQPVMGMVL